MERKFFRITEVAEICGVDREFVARLEAEQVIEPVVRSHGSIQVDLRPKGERCGSGENPVASNPQRIASRA